MQISDPANTAPKYPDQDLTAAGDQSETATRSVAENADAGTKVGEPVPADDTDALMYALSGADASSFEVDVNGQITTAEELDYETKSTYTVALLAMDPSGAHDTIMVTIMVTDENDGAVIAGLEEIEYAEGGEDAVATFTATDPDADAEDIEWSLGGPDKADFEIDGGVLTFKESPNYEKPSDRDEIPDSEATGDQGKGDNVYKVTVIASGGEQEVAVTVTDVDEDGEVTFDQPQPQATRDLKASFSDEDGKEDPTWQWSRGASKEGPWTDIQGAMTPGRNPTAADVGNYLRATVTYTDKFGEKEVSGVTANPVELRTLANAAPKFASDIEAITVNENVSGAIGDPILATDADNDILLYALDGATDADNAKFSIGKTTGQLSVKNEDGENFESDGSTTDGRG